MMKIVIGSFGLYLDGFPPSRMPLCDATRDVAEVAAGFAEAVRVMIEVTMLAMIVPGRFVAFRCCRWSRSTARVCLRVGRLWGDKAC